MHVDGSADTVDGESTAEGAKSAAIAQVLQRRIFLGEVPVGSWLRHEPIAEEFGASRTPVREALHVLSERGLVTIHRNRGAQVTGHSARDIRELAEVRSELEGFAAELAAERASDAQLERISKAWNDFRADLEKFPSRPTPEQSAKLAASWVDANHEFHSGIIEAASNRQLLESIADVHRRLPQNTSYRAYSGNSRLLRRNLREHEQIGDAIMNQDGAKARRLMTAHIRTSIDAMIRWAEDSGLVH